MAVTKPVSEKALKPSPPSKAESVALVRQMLETVERVRPHGEIEVQTLHAPTISLFWRAVSLQKAILVLIEASLVDEALILGRALFEDALRLHELQAAGTGRGALVLGWVRSSIKEKEGLMEDARRLGFPGDQSAVIARFKEERRQLDAFAANNKINRSKPFLSVRDAAMKFGRREDYWTYCLSHEMVHGSDAAFVFRRQKDEAGVHGFQGTTNKPRLVAAMAAFSARSLIQATKATAATLCWQGTREITAAEEAIRTFDP